MATNKIYVRAGATLSLLCVKKNSAGADEDVTSITIGAPLTRTDGTVVANMTVTKTGGANFTLSLTPAQTASIGPGLYQVSIKYTYVSTAVDIVDPFSVEIKA